MDNQDYEYSEVTEEFYVDQYDNVYDETGMFFCKFFMLSKSEKRIVSQNILSFY